MDYTTRIEGRAGQVILDGRFTFECHQAFKAATAPMLEAGLDALELHLASVTYMDSSSLGMLLVLREKAAAKGLRVVLVQPSSSVSAILKVVQFGKLFDIRP